ncbi:hypothetical protein TeGR_g11047 [Tetraparma gracilis]|uniref:WW domain-containing protein n=1 Tax=Tetraparma gracilis TaxID=2962635 RepID=A0ABQ6MMA2_9STRA|nr:hypothetical protein TeGR_g11047 [Tetraparma gracilis]
MSGFDAFDHLQPNSSTNPPAPPNANQARTPPPPPPTQKPQPQQLPPAQQPPPQPSASTDDWADPSELSLAFAPPPPDPFDSWGVSDQPDQGAAYDRNPFDDIATAAAPAAGKADPLAFLEAAAPAAQAGAGRVWYEGWDPARERWYYFNERTQESRWVKPGEGLYVSYREQQEQHSGEGGGGEETGSEEEEEEEEEEAPGIATASSSGSAGLLSSSFSRLAAPAPPAKASPGHARAGSERLLCELTGCGAASASDALRRCKGDVNAAADYLLSGPAKEPEPEPDLFVAGMVTGRKPAASPEPFVAGLVTGRGAGSQLASPEPFAAGLVTGRPFPGKQPAPPEPFAAGPAPGGGAPGDRRERRREREKEREGRDAGRGARTPAPVAASPGGRGPAAGAARAIAALPIPSSLPAPAAPPAAPALPAMPEEFECPITMEVMKDPVIAADGHSYERSAIAEWLAANATSPRTNEKMDGKGLIPNHGLRAMIQDWEERRKEARVEANMKIFSAGADIRRKEAEIRDEDARREWWLENRGSLDSENPLAAKVAEQTKPVPKAGGAFEAAAKPRYGAGPPGMGGGGKKGPVGGF